MHLVEAVTNDSQMVVLIINELGFLITSFSALQSKWF